MTKQDLEQIKTLLLGKFKQGEEFSIRDMAIFFETRKEPFFKLMPDYNDFSPDRWVHIKVVRPLLKSGFLEKVSDYARGDFKRVYYKIKTHGESGTL
jgi:hypothetical protein